MAKAEIPRRPNSPPPWQRSTRVRRDAVRILARYGAHRGSGTRTGSAVERFFSAFQSRFHQLFGKGGYRSLVEHAHLRAMAGHPLLEGWPAPDGEDSYFAGLPERVLEADAERVWHGAVAMTEHFLELLEGLARRGEMDGLLEAETWGAASVREAVEPAAPRGGGRGEGMRGHRAWRVLIVDRDLATCQAIARSLEEAPDFHVVDFAMAADEARARAETEGPDFVLVSGHLPVKEVLRLCGALQEAPPGKAPRVVISGLPEDCGLILRFLEAGASAVTLEEFSVEGLRLGLRLLARGEAVLPLKLQHLMTRRLSELAGLVRRSGLDLEALSDLSPRESEVLELVGKGLTNRQIARRLFISEGTVKGHVHQILRKLKVRGREEATRILHLGQRHS